MFIYVFSVQIKEITSTKQQQQQLYMCKARFRHVFASLLTTFYLFNGSYYWVFEYNWDNYIGVSLTDPNVRRPLMHYSSLDSHSIFLLDIISCSAYLKLDCNLLFLSFLYFYCSRRRLIQISMMYVMCFTLKYLP